MKIGKLDTGVAYASATASASSAVSPIAPEPSLVSNGAQRASRWRAGHGFLRGLAPRLGLDLSVKTSLRLAFASLLVGALVIGAFSLYQMRRLNASTQNIYANEYAAGLAAEQARGLLLRASRAQKALLTASTAGERNSLGEDVEASLVQIDQRMASISQLSDRAEAAALSQQLTEATTKWAKPFCMSLREYKRL